MAGLGPDGLIPALQKRGLTRTEYEHTLTENLLAYCADCWMRIRLPAGSRTAQSRIP